jgi:hypothetical protein
MGGRSLKEIAFSASRAWESGATFQQGQLQIVAGAVLGVGRHVKRADGAALEQLAPMLQHGFRGEERDRLLEDVEHHLGAGDGLVNVERLDQIIGQTPAGLKRALLHRAFEGDVDFGHLAAISSGVGGVASASAITARTSRSAACQSPSIGWIETKVPSTLRLWFCWLTEAVR